MSPSVGVVVPAYRPDVDALHRYLSALRDVLNPETLRVELDAPRRSTLEALGDAPGTVHVAPERRGKGAAITAGFEALETDVLSFADADGSTPASSLSDVIAPVVSGAAAVSVGSRRHPEADVRSHQTVLRRRLGDGFAWLARQALDVSLFDYQCGAKALSREAWRSIRSHLHEAGFAWDLEVVGVAGAMGFPIEEVPVTWEDHPESTVSPFETAIEMGTGLLAIRHRIGRLQDSPIHEAIAVLRDPSPPLIDREGAER